MSDFSGDDKTVQRSATGPAPAAGGGGGGGGSPETAMHQTRMNVTRHRRAAMRKGGGPAAPQVDIPEGGGQKLPGSVQKSMEKKLGADLSSVKVHTGGDSAGASEKLNARAFTVGSDVHFNAGQFDPGSKEGTKLLAHELTHVVQGQKGGVQKKEDEGGEADAEGKDGEALEVSDPEEPAEQEADAVADEATADMPEGGAEEDGKQADAAGGEEAKGGEAEGGEAEAAPAETEEAAPEAGAKISRKYSASALRKILRKKAFRSDDAPDPGPEAEGAAAEGEAAEGEAAEGEAAEGEAAEGEAAEAAPPAEGEGAEGAAAEGEAAEGAGEAEPAAEESKTVAAKLKGIHRKIFRSSPPPGTAPRTTADTTASRTGAVVDPPPPSRAAYDAAAWGIYAGNWSSKLVPKLLENGITQEQIDSSCTPNKSQWFEDAYNAMLSEDQAAVQTVVDRIYATCPKDPPQQRHLWSGGAPSRGMADARIDAAGAQPSGAAAATRLERTHIGSLFDGAFNSPPSKLEWEKKAKLFWNSMSQNYAAACTGTVIVNMNVDFKYTGPNKKVDPQSIFSAWELPKLIENAATLSPTGDPVLKGLQIRGMVKDSGPGAVPAAAAGKPLELDITAAQMTDPDAVLGLINAKIAATTF